MTELIDLINDTQSFNPINIKGVKDKQLKHESFQMIGKILNKYIYKLMGKYIKQDKIYLFWLDLFSLGCLNNFLLKKMQKIKILCSLTIQQQRFQIDIQFYTDLGQKIKARSTYHKNFLYRSVLEINSLLQIYKIQMNPQNGQFKLIFSIIQNFMNSEQIKQILQFALRSYVEECEAHFFLLDLIQITNRNENIFLNNINQELDILKKWSQNKKGRRNFIKSQENSNNSQFIESNQNFLTKQINQMAIYLQSEKNMHLKKQKEIFPTELIRIDKQFKKYYDFSLLFSIHLQSKNKYQNYLKMVVSETESFQNFLKIIGIIPIISSHSINDRSKIIMESKKNQNTLQFAKEHKEIILCNKKTGNQYVVECLDLKKQIARQQLLILQKISRQQSFKFLNQYVDLQNYNLTNEGILFVNKFPMRMKLSVFIQKNQLSMSLLTKLKICIKLVQIVLVFHLKIQGRISNYFPSITQDNFQISSEYNLNFYLLSTISSNPLYDLSKIITRILFSKRKNIGSKNLPYQKSTRNDEINNKYQGPSNFVNFMKYYLYEIQQLAICTHLAKKCIQDGKKNNQDQKILISKNNQNFTQICSELLVILANFETIFLKNNQLLCEQQNIIGKHNKLVEKT